MKMFFKKIIAVTTVVIYGTISAQTTVDYSLYNYNLNLVNPAFAGTKPVTELLIDSKMQWAGIKDAPRTNTFSLNMPIKENLGVGASVTSDKVFVFSQTKLAIDLSYKIKIDSIHDFHFGLKAMGNIYNGDLKTLKVKDTGGEFFTESIDEFSPNFTVGCAVVSEKYNAHLAINNLLKDKKYQETEKTKNLNRFNISFGGGYNYLINEKITFKPSAMVRIVEGTPAEFDLNSVFEFNKKYNAGVSYFWNNSLQLSGLAYFTNWFGIGYGYRLYVNDISSYQSGTHEFILSFNLDNILR